MACLVGTSTSVASTPGCARRSERGRVGKLRKRATFISLTVAPSSPERGQPYTRAGCPRPFRPSRALHRLTSLPFGGAINSDNFRSATSVMMGSGMRRASVFSRQSSGGDEIWRSTCSAEVSWTPQVRAVAALSMDESNVAVAAVQATHAGRQGAGNRPPQLGSHTRRHR